MSTNSVIAVRQENGSWQGRYVHWDGASVGEDVKRIIERDGRDKAIKTLLFDNHGWSTVDGVGPQTLRPGYDDGRFVAVPGYGIAYTTKDGQSSPDQWITQTNLNTWVGPEFVHIIEDDGSVTSLELR